MKKKLLSVFCIAFFAGTTINNAIGNVYVAENAKITLATDVMINGDLTIAQGYDNEQGAEIDLGNYSLEVANKIKVDWTIEADRWYSIGFPFDVETVFSKDFEEKGWAPYDLTATTTGTDGDYYLKEYKQEGNTYFKYVTPPTEGETVLIKAGKGYIFQFPEWFEGTVISFIGDGKTLTKANALSTEKNQLAPNINLNTSTFNLEASGISYYKYDDIDTYSLIENEETVTLYPFEALLSIEGTSNTPSFSISNNTNITNIRNVDNYSDNNDPVIKTRYYTLQGVEIQQPIENGIYIEKKIYKSGKEIGTKIFNKK